MRNFMGTAGMRLIHGLDPRGVADDLDRLYCYEQVSIHLVRAIENRLTGLASIVLEAELPEHVALAEGHASQLASRIAQLGGAITPDPTLFVERSRLPAVQVPDTGDVDAVLRFALEQEQRAIDHYGQLLDRIRGRDVVTEQLLISILSDKVAREDEIESALAQAVVTA
jgi:ferritin-like protein